MKRACPNCGAEAQKVSNHGFYKRRSDRKIIKRFLCSVCLKSFSHATYQSCYKQNKRQLNPVIERLFCSGVSQRRIAKLLGISKTTVERKFLFLALKAKKANQKYLKGKIIFSLQFDDLEAFEHSKCKPLSVTMAVENRTRKIVGFQVARMPAKGHLAKIARKKYGFRKDERPQKRKVLFKELQPLVHKNAEIRSDQSPHYPADVKQFFPSAMHHTTKGRRGCVVGQGELKATGYDPLFSLNHTYAMLRDNLKRLARRTWCTTKKASRLEAHIHIYMHYHNTVLTP